MFRLQVRCKCQGWRRRRRWWWRRRGEGGGGFPFGHLLRGHKIGNNGKGWYDNEKQGFSKAMMRRCCCCFFGGGGRGFHSFWVLPYNWVVVILYIHYCDDVYSIWFVLRAKWKENMKLKWKLYGILWDPNTITLLWWVPCGERRIQIWCEQQSYNVVSSWTRTEDVDMKPNHQHPAVIYDGRGKSVLELCRRDDGVLLHRLWQASSYLAAIATRPHRNVITDCM